VWVVKRSAASAAKLFPGRGRQKKKGSALGVGDVGVPG